MTYKRDIRTDDSIPLLVESVYNTIKDVITTKDIDGRSYYFHDNIKHFNQIYFKYPPEWKTSEVGEKIIGVHSMKINIRQRIQLKFVLYIRQYRRDKFNELANELYGGKNAWIFEIYKNKKFY